MAAARGGANAFAQGAGTSAEQVFAAVSPKVWTVKAAQPQGS
ncbi:hypothetical protein [Burkholderia glumae]|nr:hypothetical protein [Burkholderia glumae]